MMDNQTNPNDLINTIYLGDRACKSILIDGWNELVKIQVDSISRVRGETWNYYLDEDIENGFIVFSGIQSIQFEPSGFILNDSINYLKVEQTDIEDHFLFLFSAYSANENNDYQEVVIKFIAREIYLEDPLHPNVKITK
ncbi:hypothetical protein H1230_18200 [Paenibacillus sp. 19GGS1-52]|uniref:DUF6258 family protein n=1 Tax=Paenibacillus sp. 19GGS1-52 TaxID=2758563 RepID=UPI001EFA620E|nr:DUF6258 family protein [Paenibacillus sp. 19GGS1-52]ULO05053.1 hypothetical protein H1230_18200 [Paenibacillus sp. 19GGS1-52]